MADDLTIDFIDQQKPAAAAPQGLQIEFIDQPKTPRVASGISEAWTAGYQGSVAGLVDRGKLPDVVLDAHHSKWYEKLAAGASQMLNEGPEMIAGAAGGAPIGAAAGGAAGAFFAGVGAVPGAAIGGVAGGGAGAFALPTAIRESLIQYYEHRDGVSSADFLTRAGIVIKATGKDALVGAVTAGVGAKVGKLVAPLAESGTVAGRVAAGTAVAGAEVATMTVAPAALEGHLPEPEDFMNGAILVAGLKGAGAAASRMRKIYAETGRRPEQVVADAQKDPTIAQDLAAPEPATLYHGTPHEFSAFDPAKIGTGEGAQAFGRGLYLADSEAVAVHYRDVLSRAPDTGGSIANSARRDVANSWIEQAGGDRAKAVELFQTFAKDAGLDKPMVDEVSQAIGKPEGHLYKIETEKAALGKTLDWDKPLSAQPAEVKTAVEKLYPDTPADTTGADLVAKYGHDAGGTLEVDLQAAGVTGIKYLNATSRGGKGGGTNYVIFPGSEHVLNVVERSGVSLRQGIPRAYQAEAIQNRAADIIPGVKTEEVRNEPFGPITQAAGEPAKPTEINYNFMHTSEDAKASLARLSQVYEAEIQTQRRGSVSWEQTQVEAGKHIADMLGSSEPFRPREPGTPAGAAELLARKQMLQGAAEDMAIKAREYLDTPAEARTPIQTAEYLASIERAAMIQSEFLGARAEAGRALNILKETKLTADRAAHIQELISRYGKDPAELAEMLSKLDNPTAALKFAKEAQKATTWEKLMEAWKAGLVSGPITQLANVMGNGSFMAVRPLVDTAAATIGLISRGPDRVHAVEPLARVVGNLQGVSNGLKMAGAAFMADAPAGKSESYRAAIPGKLGYAVRTPFRALSAMDALFRNMVEQGEVNAISAREAAREGYNPATREFRERMAEISQNLSPEQAQAVADFGARGVFQAKPGPVAEKIFAAIDSMPAMQLIVPFKMTPLNVFKEAARISPAAPLVGEWRAAIAKGGPEAQRAMAELGVGIGIAALTASWALSGNISGNGDPDPTKRRAMMASGWQPYSVKINDTWYSYQRLAPLGMVVGAAADAADIAHHATPEESGTMAKMLAAAFANAVTNATFLQGITQLNNVITDPQRYGPRFINSLAASPIPGVVGQTAQLMDPYQREISTVTEAIKNRIPGLRETLTPSRDMFGEKQTNPDRLGGISPITQRTMSDDPVRKEAARLGVGSPEAPKSIQMPSGGDKKTGKVALTQEQRDVFGDEAGHMAHSELSKMVSSPGWAAKPDFLKVLEFKAVFEKTREWGKFKALSEVQRQEEIQRITTEIGKKLAQ